MSENTKAVVFSALLSLVCCVLITAACTGLQKYQRINAELDRQVNIIRSVGLVEDGKKYTQDEIRALYNDHIVNAWTTDSGDIVLKPPRDGENARPLYLSRTGDTLEAYIIPINVRGLWGRIYGYLAMKSDGETIKGFTVFNHSETPGLGGEIESNWFRNNFKGKKIVDPNEDFASIAVAKGSVEDSVPTSKRPNYVDGISGATLTGKYLSQGFEETLKKFEPLAKNLRKNGPSAIRL